MRRSSLAAWCVFLLVALTNAAAQTNSTSVDDKRIASTIRYEPYANTNVTKNQADIAKYQLSENSTSHNDNDHEVQYEFRSNSTKNDRTNDDEETRYEFRAHSTKNHEEGTGQMRPYELRANSTLTDDKSNSTESAYPSNELPATDENGDVISYEVCNSSVCIPLCCELGERLVNEKCVLDNMNNHLFPNIHDNTTNSSERNKTLNETFHLIVRDPCQNRGRFMLNPVEYPDDEYMFLANGSLYQPNHDDVIQPMSYCLAVVRGNKYDVTVCFGSSSGNDAPVVDAGQTGKPIGLLVSLPFLLLTFVVYSVLPELWNMHGYTLRAYVGSLFVAYSVLASLQLSPQRAISDPLCIAMGIANKSYKRDMACTLVKKKKKR